ncbi:hypothetical protein HPG69_000242 [Diceros bicornis minor]|uniref:Uncharacterized protein n=1 Tax=Diceros bicornis minor TaxID=77932 RepID=A0A7J7EVC0_DICBM|nr:hypothetical protein HPG69_000242 [Diceros bicornis minor]
MKMRPSNLNNVGIFPDNNKEVEKKLAVKPIRTKNTLSQAKLSAGAVKHKSSESGNSLDSGSSTDSECTINTTGTIVSSPSNTTGKIVSSIFQTNTFLEAR